MKRSELILTAVKPPLDYLALIFAALAAYFVRYLPVVQNIRPVVFNLPWPQYSSLVLLFAALWIIIFALAGLYAVRGLKNPREEIARVFVACSAGLALVLAVMVFSRYLFDSRFIILSVWGLAIIFVSAERLILQLVQRLAYKAGFGVHRLAIIGHSDVADILSREFKNHPTLGYRVVFQLPVFDGGAQAELKRLAEADAIDEIIQIRPNLNAQQTMDLINFAEEYHLDFKYAADLLGIQLTNLEVTTYAGLPIVEVKRTRLDGWGRIYKRIFDLIFSVIFIIIFSPAMLIIALAVKLNSAGPILFRYQRIGQQGKPFLYFKFRSMIKDAHRYRFDPEFLARQENLRQGSPMLKFKNDPRITKVGRFIRRFSLDELPELFLVFTGQMSLVGPRPHEVQEVEKYQRHHKKVLTIKPGITGLAQVSGRSDLDFEAEVRLDTYYIENWSLGLDWQIIFKTPWAIIKRRQTE